MNSLERFSNASMTLISISGSNCFGSGPLMSRFETRFTKLFLKIETKPYMIVA